MAQFNKAAGTTLPEHEADTLGGILLHAFGELPGEGDTITIDDTVYTGLAVTGHRIDRVRARAAAPPGAGGPDADAPATEAADGEA